jgi:hypothetical protein
MKKKIIFITTIAVLSLVVLSAISNLCGRLILPATVLRVEFQGYYDICGCGSYYSDSISLSRSEIRELMYHYNSSKYKNSDKADFCNSDFSFTVFLSNGTFFSVKKGGRYMEVSSLLGSYWIEGDGLEEYAMELVEKHNLATRP